MDTPIEFPQWPAEVVETLTIDGVQVDIIRHVQVEQETINSEPRRTEMAAPYEAARHGRYSLRPATLSFRGGAWSSRRPTYIEPVGASLGKSATQQGAVTAARHAIEIDRLREQYTGVARVHVGTLSLAEFGKLDPAAPIERGDIVAIRAYGRYRCAVAIKVTPTKVRAVLCTPSGEGRVQGGEGRIGDEVRLIRAAHVVKSIERVSPLGERVKVELSADHVVRIDTYDERGRHMTGTSTPYQTAGEAGAAYERETADMRAWPETLDEADAASPAGEAAWPLVHSDTPVGIQRPASTVSTEHMGGMPIAPTIDPAALAPEVRDVVGRVLHDVAHRVGEVSAECGELVEAYARRLL